MIQNTDVQMWMQDYNPITNHSVFFSFDSKAAKNPQLLSTIYLKE